MQTIAFDAASSANTTGASPFTWNHTCTGSNLVLVVALINAAGDQVTGVTYNGVAMTQVNKQNVFAGIETYIYYLINPTTGSNTISVSKSSGNMAGAAASYTGCKQSGQPDASTTGSSGAATTYAEALVSVADKCWHISGVFGNALNAITAGASTTVRANNTTTQNVAIGDGNALVTPAGSSTLNFAASSMSWASNGITLQPAPDNLTLAITQATYTMTGFAVLFSVGHTIVATVGAFTMTGFSVALTYTQKWVNAALSSSPMTNATKSSSSWTNIAQDSSTFTNQTKN